MNVPWFARVLLSSLLALLVVTPTTPTHAKADVTVKLAKKATLIEGGRAVLVEVKVACDPAAGRPIEAFLYVVQDGNQSQFAGIPVRCDRKPHKYDVRVRAFEESPFHRGPARSSAYILLLNEATGTTVSGQDSQNIMIR